MGDYYMTTENLTDMSTLIEDIENIVPVDWQLVVAVIRDGNFVGNIKWSYSENGYVFYPEIGQPQNVGSEHPRQT